MSSETRRRFLSTNDWFKFVADIQKGAIPPDTDLNALRRNVYKDIERERHRPLLVYAVKFVDGPGLGPIQIDLGDVDGFTDLVEGVDENALGVDVLIHSPGGSPEACERVVGILRNRFDKDVQFLVPHSAYSAATM